MTRFLVQTSWAEGIHAFATSDVVNSELDAVKLARARSHSTPGALADILRIEHGYRVLIAHIVGGKTVDRSPAKDPYGTLELAGSESTDPERIMEAIT